MCNYLVSIIVPVYNTNVMYLDCCLNSLLQQDYKNFEIIIVNDGSTDIETINYLSNIHNDYTKIVNTPGVGSGIARNYGLSIANGKYISFVDSDDYISKNFISSLMNIIIESDLDIAISSFNQQFEDKTIFKSKYHKKWLKKLVSKKDFLKYAICRAGSIGYVWNKIFKKDFLINNNIKFINTKYAEDTMFLLNCLEYNPKIGFTNQTTYFYRKHSSSLTNNIKVDDTYIFEHEKVNKMIETSSFNKELFKFIYRRRLVLLFKTSNKNNCLKMVKNYINRNFFKYMFHFPNLKDMALAFYVLLFK